MLGLALLLSVAIAEEPVTDLAKRIVAAAGGEARLPSRFTCQDRLVLGDKPDGKVIERTSEITIPGVWVTGGKDRIAAGDAGAAIGMDFIWGWSLKPLYDPRFTLRRAPDDAGRITVIATSAITPELTLLFQPDTLRLVELRCHGQSVRFSEWKTVAGATLPMRSVGIDAKGRVWYHDELTDVVPHAGP